jgi:hypothetical protein
MTGSYLTPWSRNLLQQLTVTQLVQKFPFFYRTVMFITMLSIAYLMPNNPVYPLHPISFRSILTLASHLHLGFLNFLLPSGFVTEIINALLIYSIYERYTLYPFHPPQFDQLSNIY